MAGNNRGIKRPTVSLNKRRHEGQEQGEQMGGKWGRSTNRILHLLHRKAAVTRATGAEDVPVSNFRTSSEGRRENRCQVRQVRAGDGLRESGVGHVRSAHLSA